MALLALVALAAPAAGAAQVLQVDRPGHPVRGTKLTLEGEPFFWMSRSSFNLLGNPDWRAYVDGAEAQGYTALRIWVAGEGPAHVIPAGPDGWNELGDRLDALAEVLYDLRRRGMAAEITLFNGESFTGGFFDPRWLDWKARAYLTYAFSLLNAWDCSVYPNVLVELVNEPHPDRGFPSDRFLDEALAFARAADACGRPLAVGTDRTGSGDYAVYHHPLDPAWHVRQYRESVDAFRDGRPALQDETLDGDDSRNAFPGATSPTLHRRAMWMTVFGGAFYTFHDNNGICTHPFFDSDSGDCGGNCDGRADLVAALEGEDPCRVGGPPGDRDFCAPGDEGCDSFRPGIGEGAVGPLVAFFRDVGYNDLRPTDDPFDPEPRPGDFVAACPGGERTPAGQCFGLRSDERPLWLVYGFWPDAAPAEAAAEPAPAVVLTLAPGTYGVAWHDPRGAVGAVGPRTVDHPGGELRLLRPPGLGPDALLAVEGR